MATYVLSENCRELVDAQAWRISELEHAREALVLQVRDLGTLLNRVVDNCIKYNDFASLRDLQEDSAEDSSQPVEPKSSAYDSALTESACFTLHHLKRLKPLTALSLCPTTLLVKIKSRSMKSSA